MITREFNLYLHAGHSIPLVINVNQYDQGEQWLFTLFNADGTQYTPSSGAIVGIKSDNLGIINSGTVDSQGRVVINETQQMTAAVGKAVFELLIDDQTHGTANFVVLVEPKPGDNADLSESDYSLFQQAIDGTSAAAIAEGVADWMDENLTPTSPVVDASLTVQGAAADAKKTGDEISALKSELSSTIEQISVNFSTAETEDVLISSATGKWYSGENSSSYFIPVPIGAKSITFTANSSYATIYALLINKLCVSGEYPDFASGETGRVTISAGETAEVTLPSDCKYVCFLKTWTTNDYTPVNTFFTVERTITDEIASLKQQVAYISETGGMKLETQNALLAFLRAVSMAVDNGEELYNDLYSTFTQLQVVSISASFNSGSHVILDVDGLDSLRKYLTVTATYNIGTSEEVTDYELSGTLTGGANVITASYEGFTTNFVVNAIHGNDITPALSSYTTSTGTAKSINGNSIRVYTTSNGTYRNVGATLPTLKEGYTYRLSYDATWVKGSYRAGIVGTATGASYMVSTPSPSATNDGSYSVETILSESANWASSAKIQLTVTWSTSTSGDVTFSNIKLIEYLAE